MFAKCHYKLGLGGNVLQTWSLWLYRVKQGSNVQVYENWRAPVQDQVYTTSASTTNPAVDGTYRSDFIDNYWHLCTQVCNFTYNSFFLSMRYTYTW